MKTSEINSDTPLVMVTIGQLKSYLGLETKGGKIPNNKPGKYYVYGLKGIQDLFHVSHSTAQIYKDGILKDAIYQTGRKIVVDVEKAIELFKESKSI